MSGQLASRARLYLCDVELPNVCGLDYCIRLSDLGTIDGKYLSKVLEYALPWRRVVSLGYTL